MKRSFVFAIMVAFFAACSTKEIDIQTPSNEDVMFYATFEQPAEDGTRVYANEDLLLRWTADDRVSIFNKNTYNQQYKFTGDTGDNAGGFDKVAGSEFTTGNAISHIVSVYPYQESTKITESETITVTLPAEQHYAENTFGLGANSMVSVTSDTFLQYKNVGGYLVLKLYGEGVSVTSITLRGNNGEKLAGKASVSMPLNGVPTTTMADDATTTITLTCETPVQLGATAVESTQFWFVVPPVTFEDGFTLTVANSAGESYEKTTTKSFSLSRNTLSRMTALEVEFGNSSDPVESTLAEIAGYADGTLVKTKPVQVMAKTMRGFIVSDDTQTMFLYTTTNIGEIAVGDIIQVTSTFTHYRELPELSKIESFERLSTGNTPAYPSPTDITDRADFDNDFFQDFRYIRLKGSLQSIRSNSIGIGYFIERSADDNLLPFYFFYPYDYQDADGYSIGDIVRAEGYFAGFNSDAICIIITCMTVIPHPEAIDLGLPSGIKWASFNLGATAPEDYGDYYAWGEIEPKSYYHWSTYNWSNGSLETLTKYNTKSDYGTVDNKTVLDLEDDAAHVTLGGNWRTPTEQELDELMTSCTWTWTTLSGINGQIVTGSNGNSIFLPAAGKHGIAGLTDAGSYGYYWSSSLHAGPQSANGLSLNSSYASSASSFRYCGFSIRPVSE